MLPDSRRSDRRGFPSRFSTSRLSCEMAMIGSLRSLASALSPREMSAISCCRLSSRRAGAAARQLQVVDDDQAERRRWRAPVAGGGGGGK